MGIEIRTNQPEEVEQKKIAELTKANPELAGKEEAIDRLVDKKQKEWDEKHPKRGDSSGRFGSIQYDPGTKTFNTSATSSSADNYYGDEAPAFQFTLEEVDAEQALAQKEEAEKAKTEESKEGVKNKYKE